MVGITQTESGWQAQCRCGWRSDYGTESDMELARIEHREYVHGIIEQTPEFPDASVVISSPQAYNVFDSSELVDADEAAEILGITLNNLRQIVFKKKLTAVEKRGRKVYYSRDDVSRLALSRATRSPV